MDEYEDTMQEQHPLDVHPLDADPLDLTDAQRQEVAADQGVEANRLRAELQANGRLRLHYDPQGTPEQIKFVTNANANGGQMNRDLFENMVEETTLAYSVQMGRMSPEEIKSNVLLEVLVPHYESMYGCDESDAKKHVSAVVDRVLDFTGVNAESRQLKDINEVLASLSGNDYKRVSRAHRLLPLFTKKGGDVFYNGGAGNVDLYNAFHGREFVNGQQVDGHAWREDYWRATFPDKPMPKTQQEWNMVLHENEGNFAKFMFDSLKDQADQYEKAFSSCARHEILRRWNAAAAANGGKLDYNRQMDIVHAVVLGRGNNEDADPFNDSYGWRAVLTPADVAQAQHDAHEEICRRIPGGQAGLSDALQKVRGTLGEMRQQAAAYDAAVAADKEAVKAAAAAEKKAEKEAAAAEKKRQAYIAKGVTPPKPMNWAYDGRGDSKEEAGVRLNRKDMEQLTQDFDLNDGDVIVANVKIGSRYMAFPVVGTYSSDTVQAVALNVNAMQKATPRGKQIDRYRHEVSDVKFTIVRKGGLTKPQEKTEQD